MTKMRTLIEQLEEAREEGLGHKLPALVKDFSVSTKALVAFLEFGHGHSGELGRAYDALMKAGHEVQGAAKRFDNAWGAVREAAGEH
jgi:hypothetical protein